MSSLVTWALKGTDKVVENLAKFEKSLFREMTYGAQAVQAKVVIDARKLVPYFKGTLSISIQEGPITITDTNIEAIVSANADYASFLEYGTRPHFPPPDALRDWCRTVLGDAGLAFVVARAISRRGSPARPFMGPALEANRPVFKSAMEAARNRAIATLG